MNIEKKLNGSNKELGLKIVKLIVTEKEVKYFR